jgi:hypothetical protein
MPFPWRERRCFCGLLATMDYQGENFCVNHFPFMEVAVKKTRLLAEIVGDEKKNELIDLWFPLDESFSWSGLLNKVEELLPKLELPTGLLSLYP